MECSDLIAIDLQQGDISTTLCKGAEPADILIRLTSSFRTTLNVAGEIVKPATRSKHRTGHAIDMNVVYNNKTAFANSQVLGRYPEVPKPVQRFIKSIIDDPDIRWGGDFFDRDPVHIDDGLNLAGVDCWEQRNLAMQRAVQLGV